ncbi:MAG TPA: hypothetical protein PLV53_07560, partial [Anaerolineaceae bacterium]|nr:hypothetical protein [Anaerolineaceae bacterium]
KQELSEKISQMRTQLEQSLRAQFKHEIERSVRNINDAISPYTRFVRSERDKIQESKVEFDQLETELSQLAHRAELLTQ